MGLVPVAPSTDTVVERAEQQKNEPDDNNDDSDGDENGNVRQPSDQQKNQSENNHCDSLSYEATAAIRFRAEVPSSSRFSFT